MNCRTLRSVAPHGAFLNTAHGPVQGPVHTIRMEVCHG